jgi:hypothetical protein
MVDYVQLELIANLEASYQHHVKLDSSIDTSDQLLIAVVRHVLQDITVKGSVMQR